jgi:hypothetical protein
VKRIPKMLPEQFLEDYKKALKYATEIFKKVFYEKIEDVEFGYEYNADTNKYDNLVISGDSEESNNYCSFPAYYITLTIPEIQQKEEERIEKERLAELKREEERKPQIIEAQAREIKIWQNSLKAAKERYKTLAGEEYSD